MERLPLDKLGARETAPGRVRFGLLTPGISNADGSRIAVRIISREDQFIQAVPPVELTLDHGILDGHGDFWSGEILLEPTVETEETLLYRYVLKRPGKPEIDNIIDPFAREFGQGHLSAITLGYVPYEFSETESSYKTPFIADAIIYELMIAEFGGDIENTIRLLDYLDDLGVNVIEVMPVSNVAARLNWGYDPIGYFGIDERFGKRRDFQRLVDEAHKRGIAVVIDSVYGHVDGRHPYAWLYDQLGGAIPNPFIGPFGTDEFGKSTDSTKGLRAIFLHS